MAEEKPKSLWREEALNIGTLVVLGLFGVFEQRSEGQFRIFMLPGWPTYAVVWALYLGALLLKRRQRQNSQIKVD
jgi:hypothetical protein